MSPDIVWDMNWAEYMLLCMDFDAEEDDSDRHYVDSPEEADKLLFG